ncbi:MAG: hypothetical protein VW405_02805 [Rhodospirillaceae bacterium]
MTPPDFAPELEPDPDDPMEAMEPEVEEEWVEPVPDADLVWFARSDEGLAAACEERENDWWEYAQNHGFVDMWLAMIAEYYGQDPSSLAGFDAAQIDLDGDEGELVRFRIAELRVYVRQAINATTRERPAFKAAALNTSHATISATQVIDALADSVYERCMGEKRERRLVERGELAGRAFVWAKWDDGGGDRSQVPVVLPPGTALPDGSISAAPIELPEMQEVRSGEPVVRVKCPWDVFEDPTVDDDDDHAWRIVRERRSKHELMAAYPDKVDLIRSASVMSETAYELMFAFDSDLPRDDDAVVKHLYVPPSQQLPEGLYAVILGRTVLERLTWDEAMMPGDYMPVVVYEPSEMIECSFGYSESWDQLVIQQMLTQVISDVATNISALGRQFLMLPQGSEISPDQLANGMFAAYVPPDQIGKIAAPNLAQIGTGAQWFVGFLQKMDQMLAGENSVSMGDPSENIKSGTMAALFHAIALEKKHQRQAALDHTRERVCTMIVDYIRRYAQGPMLAKTLGPDAAPKLQQFNADTFEPVRQVFIETTNPMLRTRSGQMEIANYYKEIPGAIRTPAQALQALTTGKVDPLFQSAQAELTLIQWENEQLRAGTPLQEEQEPVLDQMGMPVLDEMTGQPRIDVYQTTPQVPVLAVHDPFQHVNEHLTVVYDPNASPEARKAAEAHVLWHLRIYPDVPPELAAIRGFPPAMAAAPQPAITSPDGGKGPPEVLKDNQSPVDEAGGGLPKAARPPKESAAPGA